MKLANVTPQQIRDCFALSGFGLLVAGLIGYDWRLASIVCGILLLYGAVDGTIKGSRS